MQNNPLLSALLIVGLTATAVVVGLGFIQYQGMEEKLVRLHDQVQSQDTSVNTLKRTVESSVGQLERKVDGSIERLQEDLRATRDRAAETSQHFDTLVRLAREGLLGGARPGDSSGGATAPANSAGARPKRPIQSASRAEDRTSQPSVIAGVQVYPYNPGWTVLCDEKTNADPKRDLPPPEQVDWEAVLNDYVAGEPKGLNFYSDDRTVTVAALSYYVHDWLAERKTTDVQEWNAKLASRIEESPDRRVYMIYLRPGLRWHDPEPKMLAAHPFLAGDHYVTAHDVKFTYDLLRNANTPTPLKVFYEPIDSVELVDDYTVKVTWKETRFYNRASTLELQPLPEHIWAYDPSGNRYPEADVYAQFGKHWFSSSMCGNGPYRFVEYALGQYIRCVRNNSYHLDRPTCREYVVNIIRDDDNRLAAFWNDKITLNILNPEQYRTFVLEGDEQRPVYNFEDRDRPAPSTWKHCYYIWRRPTYGGFGWNMRKPLFKEATVRRALTLALNRYAVPEKFFYGLGEVIPIGESVFSPYFNPERKPLPFDLAEAARLLQEAGWVDTDGDGVRDKVVDGTKLDFEFQLLISSSSPDQVQICQMYKEDLLKIGVKMSPNPAESALWSRQIHDRTFDGFVIFWTAGFDSDPRQLWDSSKVDEVASNNYPGYANPEADKIFAQLDKAFDYPTRIELMNRWYDMEFEAQPYTWIWSVHSPVIFQADWRLPEARQNPPHLDRRLMFRWKARP
ncbi:MAG: ABC transporter substrate-binding protein [Planctomycetota bacterium]